MSCCVACGRTRATSACSSRRYPDDADPITLNNLVNGLTSFVRTLISGNAPYDRYLTGVDDNAISPSAHRGSRLFFSEQLECFHCHGGFNFAGSDDA